MKVLIICGATKTRTTTEYPIRDCWYEHISVVKGMFWGWLVALDLSHCSRSGLWRCNYHGWWNQMLHGWSKVVADEWQSQRVSICCRRWHGLVHFTGAFIPTWITGIWFGRLGGKVMMNGGFAPTSIHFKLPKRTEKNEISHMQSKVPTKCQPQRHGDWDPCCVRCQPAPPWGGSGWFSKTGTAKGVLLGTHSDNWTWTSGRYNTSVIRWMILYPSISQILTDSRCMECLYRTFGSCLG